MSASICIEEGPRGITSNVIAPGAIADTEGVARLSKEGGEGGRDRSRIPSGRAGTVKEVADATVYVFSDAGNYVNGSIVVGKSCPSALVL
jgi:peroxisomal 2,4-dienoyl-CoA reductase